MSQNLYSLPVLDVLIGFNRLFICYTNKLTFLQYVNTSLFSLINKERYDEWVSLSFGIVLIPNTDHLAYIGHSTNYKFSMINYTHDELLRINDDNYRLCFTIINHINYLIIIKTDLFFICVFLSCSLLEACFYIFSRTDIIVQKMSS